MQHPLIVGIGAGRFGFDHPEFYHFFLGEAIGEMLLRGDISGLRHAARQGALPPLSIESAARLAARKGQSVADAVAVMNCRLCHRTEAVASARELERNRWFSVRGCRSERMHRRGRNISARCPETPPFFAVEFP